jgi:hypothetical protein
VQVEVAASNRWKHERVPVRRERVESNRRTFLQRHRALASVFGYLTRPFSITTTKRRRRTARGFRSQPLRIVDPDLGGVNEDLVERLGCLEAMPRQHGHPPGRDRRQTQPAEPTITEHPHRLRQQPAQLLDLLRLAAVLGEMDVDELAQRRRLDQACSRRNRSSARFRRRLLRREAATLNTPRPAPAHPVSDTPTPARRVTRRKLKHLSLLHHRGSLLSSRPPTRTVLHREPVAVRYGRRGDGDPPADLALRGSRPFTASRSRPCSTDSQRSSTGITPWASEAGWGLSRGALPDDR